MTSEQAPLLPSLPLSQRWLGQPREVHVDAGVLSFTAAFAPATLGDLRNGE